MDVAIADARARVLAAIEAAARRAGREPVGIEVVAITKGVAADRVREAVSAGFRTLGENRVQEAEPKVAEVAKVAELATALAGQPAWHLVGPLQSNKARRAVALFDVIETVDTLALAVRLDRLAGEIRPGSSYPVLLEVNVDADPAKAGFRAAEIGRDLPAILELPNLRVEGLMTVGRLVSDPEQARPTFTALRRLSESLRAAQPGLGGGLSMGMTDDFAVAVEEGATIVRLGRAIFGSRH